MACFRAKNFTVLRLAILAVFLSVPTLLPAEDEYENNLENWRALDSEFRQAMIDEILARRGLTGSVDSAGDLIRSAEDIREALLVSCELSGACADEAGLATLGERLRSFPEYDEEEGSRNAEIVLRLKSGDEN